MPSPLRQLALVIQFGMRNFARIPATVLFVPKHGGPETLHVVAGFRINALHFPQEEFLQNPLEEFLWVLVDSFASYREDGARLEADRTRMTIMTEIVEEVSEVLRRCLGGFFALEDALG